MIKKYLADNGVNCRCHHDPDDHHNAEGACMEKETVHLLRHDEPDVPCACLRYRPSLFWIAVDAVVEFL